MALSGEAMAQAPVIRSNSRVVQIDVTVKDARGHAIDGLKAVEFHVTDNGKPRVIRIFGDAVAGPQAIAAPRPSAPLPEGLFSNELTAAVRPTRATVILIDGVNAPFEGQSVVRQRAIAMLEQSPAGDPIAVYAMTPDLKILHDYTTDRNQLAESIRRFVPVPPRMPEPPPFPPRPGTRMTGPQASGEVRFLMDNRIRDTLNMLRAVGEHMAMLPGRKAILWVTQSFPPAALNSFRVQFDETMAALNEANVAIYPVDARGLTPGNDPKNIIPPDVDMFPAAALATVDGFLHGTIDTMKEIADATGGQAFYDRNDIEKAMQEAIDDARPNYTLGFYLPDEEADGAFHRLQVHVAAPGAALRYRQGYFAGGEGGNEVDKKADLESALLSPLDETAVIVAAKLDIRGSGKDRTAQLRVFLDPHTLSLKNQDGLGTGDIDEMFIEMDASGTAVAKTASHVQFRISPARRESYNRTGATYTKMIRLDAHATKILIIVRDQATGHVGSLTIPLTPPAEAANPPVRLEQHQ